MAYSRANLSIPPMNLYGLLDSQQPEFQTGRTSHLKMGGFLSKRCEKVVGMTWVSMLIRVGAPSKINIVPRVSSRVVVSPLV